MQVKLFKKPKNPTIIEGFPGFGLIGTITTEFLIDHLKTELIGKVWMDEIPAMVAIHDNKVVEPLGIFYNTKYNLVIIHGITAITGVEWPIAQAVVEVAKLLKAKEIISVEGVGSATASAKTNIYYYASHSKNINKFKRIKVPPLKEGIIMGVTGAVLVRSETTPTSCIFAETQSNLPDSKAAAKVIEAIDAYLGLKVDYKPLIQQAEQFEEKLKGIVDKSNEAMVESEKKKLSYVG